MMKSKTQYRKLAFLIPLHTIKLFSLPRYVFLRPDVYMDISILSYRRRYSYARTSRIDWHQTGNYHSSIVDFLTVSYMDSHHDRGISRS